MFLQNNVQKFMEALFQSNIKIDKYKTELYLNLQSTCHALTMKIIVLFINALHYIEPIFYSNCT